VKSAKYTNTIGQQLATVWTDPDFNPAQRAFTMFASSKFRRRVIPSMTPSRWDVKETGQPATIQEGILFANLVPQASRPLGDSGSNSSRAASAFLIAGGLLFRSYVESSRLPRSPLPVKRSWSTRHRC
jgi:hypothetical protein